MNHDRREEVYETIDRERAHQDSFWGKSASDGRPGHGERSIDEFATYVAGYSAELTRVCSKGPKKYAKLDIIRKIAALCVQCMEQHGMVDRT